jgi:hypothetical protein
LQTFEGRLVSIDSSRPFLLDFYADRVPPSSRIFMLTGWRPFIQRALQEFLLSAAKPDLRKRIAF